MIAATLIGTNSLKLLEATLFDEVAQQRHTLLNGPRQRRPVDPASQRLKQRRAALCSGQTQGHDVRPTLAMPE